MADHSPNGHAAPPPDAGDSSERSRLSRRSFIQTMSATAAVTSLQAAASASVLEAKRKPLTDDVPVTGPDAAEVTLQVNGKALKTNIEPGTTLLEALRIQCHLTGSKDICDRGSCGGCSVLVDGKLTVSCMMLAHDAVGAEITTVEGLAKGDKLDPVQEMFVKHDALQCGFCTPGLVVASRALLNQNPKPTLEEIKNGLSGNICRCGTYTNIFNAVLEASGQPPIMDSKGGA